MKIYQQIGLIAVVLCGIAALEARAQLAGTEVGPGSFILNFDENQNGSMNLDGTGWAAHPGGFATDPNTGILQLLYTVNAAGLVDNGDVRIYDDFIGGHISDVLRFTDLNGNMGGQTADRMFFIPMIWTVTRPTSASLLLCSQMMAAGFWRLTAHLPGLPTVRRLMCTMVLAMFLNHPLSVCWPLAAWLHSDCCGGSEAEFHHPALFKEKPSRFSGSAFDLSVRRSVEILSPDSRPNP